MMIPEECERQIRLTEQHLQDCRMRQSALREREASFLDLQTKLRSFYGELEECYGNKEDHSTYCQWAEQQEEAVRLETRELQTEQAKAAEETRHVQAELDKLLFSK